MKAWASQEFSDLRNILLQNSIFHDPQSNEFFSPKEIVEFNHVKPSNYIPEIFNMTNCGLESLEMLSEVALTTIDVSHSQISDIGFEDSPPQH